MLDDRWERALPSDLAAWAWASVARQSAIKLQPEAADQFLRAERVSPQERPRRSSWPTTCWPGRCAPPCAPTAATARWQQVVQAIDAMTPAEQQDPAWVYWKARAPAGAGQGLAGRRGAADAAAASCSTGIAGQLQLLRPARRRGPRPAAALPPRQPAPLTPAERDAAAGQSRASRARWR